MKITKTEMLTAVKAMAAIVVITFLAELVVMALLAYLGRIEQSSGVILFDAAALALLIAPPIYWLVLAPVHREYQKRLMAESRADDLGQLAITDVLTSIMNRRGITMALLDTMSQAERYGTPLSIVMADIDHFKLINDNYGHKAGDKVLILVAEAMAEVLRMPDKIGRYGGEEFLLVLPHTTLAQGRKLAERLRVRVETIRPAVGSKVLSLTISSGVTQFYKGEDLEQFLARADQAMYDAKQAGRDRVAVRKRS
ncbi:MAG: GGDEF domain-containing protein [Gammaproteobacteria bacterium]|nr:GGDEF domain-containing protein [Gammaproteobacteria bacterium]